MAYLIDGTRVQRVTVEAVINGQKIIDRYHLAYFGVPPDPSASDSGHLLASFQTAYRTSIIPVAWDDYSVFRYKIEEISDVLKPDPTKKKYRVVADASKFDQIFGGPGDVGTIASAGLTKIPTHEVLRLLLTPSARVPKRFRGNYLFLSIGQPTSSLSTTPEKWATSFITAQQTAWNAFVGTAMFGVSPTAGSGYKVCLFSAPYYFEVVKSNPVHQVWDASRFITSTTPEPFIGSRASRRFKPTGGFRGI